MMVELIASHGLYIHLHAQRCATTIINPSRRQLKFPDFPVYVFLRFSCSTDWRVIRCSADLGRFDILHGQQLFFLGKCLIVDLELPLCMLKPVADHIEFQDHAVMHKPVIDRPAFLYQRFLKLLTPSDEIRDKDEGNLRGAQGSSG